MDFAEFKSLLTADGLTLSETQINQYRVFLHMLQEWNKVMDLTAIDEEEAIIEKHFYDSLISFRYFKYGNQTILDLGSGAGFPGLVLKIAFPSLKITLLEPTLKRCNFLNAVIKELKLNDIEVINDRAETYVKQVRESFDIVTARAVSQLNILLELSIPFLRVSGTMIALKGKNAEYELKQAENAMKILKISLENKYYFTLPSEKENRYILLLKKNSHTDIRYPRNYGAIKKKPL